MIGPVLTLSSRHTGRHSEHVRIPLRLISSCLIHIDITFRFRHERTICIFIGVGQLGLNYSRSAAYCNLGLVKRD
jgi:hypothetical protein